MMLQMMAMKFVYQLLFILIIILPISTSVLLAKTRESFKLLELQNVAARLLLDECDRIIVDAATGSSLFSISSSGVGSFQRQCDWVGEVLVRAGDPMSLVSMIKEMVPPPSGWILEYTRFSNNNQEKTVKHAYSSRTIISCVAQAIGSEAQIDPNRATSTLMIVDTIEEFFLVRLPDKTKLACSSSNIAWAKRPFQYSSSINFNMAEMIIDILHDIVSQNDEGTIRLLDPTCGSGTFLALGLARGMSVQGWDINQACVNGAIQNLEFYFGDDSKWSAIQRDATIESETEVVPNCVVANVPWGINTNRNDNAMILQQLKQVLRPQTPCAFVSKSQELQTDMERLGYSIVAFCHVPPKDFLLPPTKKKNNSSLKQNSNSQCVITIARSP